MARLTIEYNDVCDSDEYCSVVTSEENGITADEILDQFCRLMVAAGYQSESVESAILEMAYFINQKEENKNE